MSDVLNEAKIRCVAEILMAAAHADGVVVGEEEFAIEDILLELLDIDQLPEGLSTLFSDYDPESFDLTANCEELDLKDPDERRSLLKLIERVTEADNIIDLEEDAFIRQVAMEIGSEPEEYDDLTVDIISIHSLKAPPIPTE